MPLPGVPLAVVPPASVVPNRFPAASAIRSLNGKDPLPAPLKVTKVVRVGSNTEARAGV